MFNFVNFVLINLVAPQININSLKVDFSPLFQYSTTNAAIIINTGIKGNNHSFAFPNSSDDWLKRSGDYIVSLFRSIRRELF